jgi:hypothetical protein
MAQIKRDLFCISVRSRNYCSVLFEHTQGIRIGDAELRSGLHLATIGTDKPLASTSVSLAGTARSSY